LDSLGPFDLLLTDPPYGVGWTKERMVSLNVNPSKQHLISKLKDRDWDIKPGQDLIDKIVAMASKAIIFGGNHFSMPASPAWLVWDKDNGNTKFSDCELAWTNLDMSVRMMKWRRQGFRQENEGARREPNYHPSQKPLAVIKWALNFAVKDNRVTSVFDPYMGSGTTLVAASIMKLDAVGIEMSREYCDITIERLSQKTLPLAYHMNGVEAKEQELFRL